MPKMLCCLLLFVCVSSSQALEFWQQNSTYFTRFSSEETAHLTWTNSLPPKQTTSFTVNGTYFNSYNNQPVAFIKRWAEIYFDQPSHIPARPLLFLPLDEPPNISYNRQQLGRWSIGGGPMLVENSIINIRCSEEKFRYDVRTSRRFAAVGVDKENNLIVVTTFNRNLNDIAWCLHFLGCTEAMRLDGGNSTYLYVKNNIEIGYRGSCSNYIYLLE